jgi:dynein heavy chain
LEKAEPALIEAQNAVQGVTKGNIDEIKNFANPPAAVKLALEPVIALVLGLTKAPDWAAIKTEVKREGFK